MTSLRWCSIVIFVGWMVAFTAGVLRAEEATDVAKAVREQAPLAASMSAADFDKIAKSPGVPKVSDIASQSLTFLVLAAPLKEKPSPEQLAEFQGTGGGPLPPAKLASAIRPRLSLVTSVLQPSYINDVTCTVAGENATGVITFEAPNVYKGKVANSAAKRAGKWQIVEFTLPARGLKTSLADSGAWKMTGGK